MRDSVQVSYEELRGTLEGIFAAHGCPEGVASLLAANMAGAERDGALSHGIFRMKGHLATIKSGWIDPSAEPRVEDVAPGMVRVDARNGYAIAALEAARDLLCEKARHSGTAILAIRNSQHFSALWPDVETFARDGFVAMEMVNSMAVVTPFRGRKPVYGTNPVAFAAPRGTADPLVFDQASSALAHGDVQIAARENRQLPEGAGVDRNGNPTTDPHQVLNGGALLPFGGHKGSSIAMMVEIMGAALTGGAFSFEIDWSAYPGASIPRTGLFLLLIDPDRGGTAPFAARMETLIATLEAAGVERLPGDRRYANRRRAETNGIPLAQQDWLELQNLAG